MYDICPRIKHNRKNNIFCRSDQLSIMLNADAHGNGDVDFFVLVKLRKNVYHHHYSMHQGSK